MKKFDIAGISILILLIIWCAVPLLIYHRLTHEVWLWELLS